MRARRRQGWWACAFGVLATESVALVLVHERITYGQAGLSVLYGTLIGLVLGWIVIRLDLALTGSRGTRARRADPADRVRPEPRRWQRLM